MQIPKQPRTKTSVATTPEPESTTVVSQGSAVLTMDEINKQLQQAYASYLENVNSANHQAQLEHAKAYLAYLEKLHQPASLSGPDPSLDYWKDVLNSPDNTQAAADAQRKHGLASVNQYADYQKTVTDAVTGYSESTRNIWQKFQSDVEQHNKDIADVYKNALLKVDVDTTSIPALSLLYQGLRTTGATSTNEAAKPV